MFSRNISLTTKKINYIIKNLSSTTSTLSSSSSTSLINSYELLLKEKNLKPDKHQLTILRSMDKLHKYLLNFDFDFINNLRDQELELKYYLEEKNLENYKFNDEELNNINNKKNYITNNNKRLKSYYLWGPVGSGKTMLMKLFYNNLIENDFKDCWFIHHNEFLSVLNKEIHLYNQESLINEGRKQNLNLKNKKTNIEEIAKKLSKKYKIIFYDEFQVTDIYDAMLLTRFFNEFLSRGSLLITTSNRAPEFLYEDGLKRNDFLTFINELNKNCIVKKLDNLTDYRRIDQEKDEKETENYDNLLNKSENIIIKDDNILNSYEKTFFLNEKNESIKQIHSKFLQDNIKLKNKINKNQYISHIYNKEDNKYIINISYNRNFQISSNNVDTESRSILISFDDLFMKELSPLDFQIILRNFPIIYIPYIPNLTEIPADSLRRFLSFIDEAYNLNAKLIYGASMKPYELFDSHKIENKNYIGSNSEVSTKDRKDMGQQEDLGDSAGQHAAILELPFAFRRAASRLIEMKGKKYLENFREKYIE